MPNQIEKKELLELRARALKLRIDSVRATTVSKSGHPTTCLSAAEIITALFFKSMSFDVANPDATNNDRFILSKGHGVPVLYAAYKQLGVISDDELMQLREFDSPLEGHPTPRFIYNEAATGSLGQGLAIGAGMALSAQRDGLSYKTYVLLGDGEVAEGSVWEAAEFAAYYKLDNLVGIIDLNRLGQAGETLFGHDVAQLEKKFDAFGWETHVVDGHNIEEVLEALESARFTSGRPSMIIAKTYKGYGVRLFEDKNGFHGKPVKQDELDGVLSSLQERFPEEVQYLEENNIMHPAVAPYEKRFVQKQYDSVDLTRDPQSDLFKIGETLATRKAFGYGLAALGRVNDDVVVLDGDVKNSTFTDIFEKEFAERFVQCFIAEQTMIGVATGMQSRGKISFAATFGAFFTRAHDQIRMAGVGVNALRLCGSHCGVSIGEDGPSQMGLEDIAMMRAIPYSIVLYPSDAVCAYKLMEKMAAYNDGISYMRTTRSATSVLYGFDESFEIGGCKVLRQSDQDQACIVAAGITLHEALKAYEVLKGQGILVSVIDAYSVKPLDVKTIKAVAKKSGKNVITVEDHYIEGGLGEAVASALADETSIRVKILGVKQLSRSGKSEELLAYAGIDSEAISGAANHLL